MKPTRVLALLVVLALTAVSCSTPDPGPSGPRPLMVGAVYPLSGSQGPGGIEEYRGVQVAAQLVNDDGGVRGRRIALDPVDTPGADAAPGAIAALAGRGVHLVVGSYGSTISSPAGVEAVGRGSLFWETGAVGKMAGVGAGDRVFRVTPTGGTLGRSAISFIAEQVAPRLRRDPASLRFALAEVDDLYGQGVADGARAELTRRGLAPVADIAYDPHRYDARRIVSRLKAARPDVLFVVAYLDDGIALRREQVRQRLPLLANIGTSSSYCMPAFGAALGRDAVGLFASDKPDTHGINSHGLDHHARELLDRADRAYRTAHGASMSAAALAGFSGAWALFHDVLPAARSEAPADVSKAALAARIPRGGLPNGSGLEFGAPGTPDAGANLRAASVIWQWTKVNQREVTWPPQFATAPVSVLRIAR